MFTNLLYSHICEGKNWLHGYHVHEALNKIVKSMAPESGVHGLGSDQIGITLYIINVNLDLRKYSSALPNIFVRNKMHGYVVHEVPYLNCKIHHDT